MTVQLPPQRPPSPPELAHASHAVSVAFHYGGECIEKASVRCRNCQFALWSVINFRPKPGGGQSRVMPPECQSCGQLVCYACGCTENMACAIQCVDGVLPCAWVGPGLCSHCLWKLAEYAYHKTNADLANDLIHAGILDRLGF